MNNGKVNVDRSFPLHLFFLSQEPGDACISVVPGAKVTCPTEFHVPKVPAVQRGEANVWGFVKSR